MHFGVTVRITVALIFGVAVWHDGCRRILLLQRKVAQEKEKTEGPSAAKGSSQRAPAAGGAPSKQRTTYGDDIADGKDEDRGRQDFKDGDDA